MNEPPRIGDRIVIFGFREYDAHVKEVKYIDTEARHHIILDWGIHGTSRIYDTDEGKVWYRWNSTN